jgi:DNA-binding transcriptional regulator YhcF (GntR family)
MTAKTNFVPKYQKVQEAILQDIRSEKLSPGDKLPVREELVKKYNATRTTIDKALSGLIEQKLLTASRRHGTFVAEKKLLRRIALVSWEASIKRHSNYFANRYNYFSLFGTLLKELQDCKFEIVDADKSAKKPQILKDYDLILWNALPLEILNTIVSKLDCRDKIILLNRYYKGFRFASTNHKESACELTKLFLENLPEDSLFYFLDVQTENLGMKYVLEERKNGFLKACEEYRRFYRMLEVSLSPHPNYFRDISSMKEIKAGNSPACVISPSMLFTGAIMRFAAENQLRLNQDIFYADFNNENSVINTGYPIPSVLEDFMSIAEASIRIIDSDRNNGKCFVPHKIINNPFLAAAEGNDFFYEQLMAL